MKTLCDLVSEFRLGDVVVKIGWIEKYFIQSIDVDCLEDSAKVVLVDMNTLRSTGELDMRWLDREWIRVEKLNDRRLTNDT